MSLFKFGTIGAYKNTINNPRATSAIDVKNGYVFKITGGDTAEAFTDAADAKAGNVWVAMNIIDTPELLSQSDFVVKAGQFINAFKLDNLKGLTVELSSDLVTTAFADVAVGEHLVPVPDGAGAMQWVEAPAVDGTGYAVTLKVLEKTTFGGTGFYCEISSN